MFNATLNNISAISWRSVLLVEEPEYPYKTIGDMVFFRGKTCSAVTGFVGPIISSSRVGVWRGLYMCCSLCLLVADVHVDIMMRIDNKYYL
jgi:hypothetical protein